MKANQRLREFEKDEQGIIFELLIGAVFALVVGYTAMNIGIYITGTVSNSLIESYPDTSAERSDLQNLTVWTLENLSVQFSSNNQMVSTAYLITIITLPLMAILVIKQMV